MRSDRAPVIALAGIFQAAFLTRQIAQKGMADSAAVETSIQSLFQTTPESVEAVYGGLEGLTIGLNQLRSQLSAINRDNADISRYALSLIHLARKLEKKPAMLEKIAEGIRQAGGRLELYPPLHSNIMAQLADIYAQTVSTLHPRIMVAGEPIHLQNPENANRIRSLLLAGIRSAILWRQCGGKQTQLLFRRRRLTEQARALLHEIERPDTDCGKSAD